MAYDEYWEEDDTPALLRPKNQPTCDNSVHPDETFPMVFESSQAHKPEMDDTAIDEDAYTIGFAFDNYFRCLKCGRRRGYHVRLSEEQFREAVERRGGSSSYHPYLHDDDPTQEVIAEVESKEHLEALGYL